MTDLALRAFQIFITLVYNIREKLGAEPQNYRVIQVVYRVGILNIGYAHNMQFVRTRALA